MNASMEKDAKARKDNGTRHKHDDNTSCNNGIIQREQEEEITVISADDREDCEKFVSEIRSFYPSLAEANITITDLGPTICAHVGPDFLAVAYRGAGRIR